MQAISEKLGPATLGTILRGRHRNPGQMNRLYKADVAGADESSDAMMIDVSALEAVVDEKNMSVGPVTISTPAQDRAGDVLIPTGIVLDRYVSNPVVFWDHGFSGEDSGSMPIANSEDRNGNLSIEVTDEAVNAWAYFHGKTALSNQVFSLVAAKAIRAASVRPVPLPGMSELIDYEGDPGILMHAWELVEWSFCGIGVNQEALTKALRDKRIEGEPIARPLLKSFGSLIKNIPAIGRGFDSSSLGAALKKKSVSGADRDNQELKAGGMGMNTEDEDKFKGDGMDNENPDDTDETKADDPESEAPEETKMDEGSSGTEDESASEETKMEGDGETEDEVTQMKYGAQVLSAFKASMKELVEGAKPSLGALENESVKQMAEEMIADFEAKMSAIDGLYDEQYPDQPKMDGSSDDDSGEEGKSDGEPSPEETEEALKSFLRSGQLHRYSVKGFAGQVAKIANAKNLTPTQRAVLKSVSSGMGRIEKAAATQTETKLEKDFRELKSEYKSLQEMIKRVTPYERV